MAEENVSAESISPSSEAAPTPSTQPASPPKYQIKINHYPNIPSEDGFPKDCVNIAYKYNLPVQQAEGFINEILQIRDEEFVAYKETLKEVYVKGAQKQEEKFKTEAEAKAKEQSEAIEARLKQEFNGEHTSVVNHVVSKAKGLNMSEDDVTRLSQVVSNEPSALLFLKSIMSEYDKSVPAVKVAASTDDSTKPSARDIENFNRAFP
jgi:hypothetical protein